MTPTPVQETPEHKLGVSGRIAAYFQSAQITPLLALLALLLGVFAVLVTPREEEPQIDVTMAQVMVAFPGAGVGDVEQMVATPAEQILSQMTGVEHVMSLSRPGMALLTVQFKVGVPRSEALVRLQEAVGGHADWLPRGLGVQPPLIKPMGIADVPMMSFTLFSRKPEIGAYELERVARSLEIELKRVPGTREVKTIGGPGRALRIAMDPARLASMDLTVADLRQALQGAHGSAELGSLLINNQALALEAGAWLGTAEEVQQLVVGVHAGKPVFLSEVATISEGPMRASQSVWHGEAGGQEYPAVTLSISKNAGENAIDVALALRERMESLRNSLIPADIEVAETRNYGATANDKAQKLIQKLLFATAAVVALVFFALGRREAAIVGTAVILTLMLTLFASWAWGFTLNRVSLFALIFSIGILVDDAIVVVENIHRHQQLFPGKPLVALIPGAVDEVGGPTILATLTVIAALLPMAFVSGLMGPYMSPIPINASMGMLLSLAIAFVLTPWLARLWMKPSLPAEPDTGTDTDTGSPADAHALHGFSARLAPLFERIFHPLLDARSGRRMRGLLGLAVAALIAVSLALPATGLVLLKMLPFDNKSEFQVIVDLPVGTPMERSAGVLRELGALLARQPEVLNYQAYAGTASPINFNGLVRQYGLRSAPEQADIQVNLLDRHQRSEQSHAIATRLRPLLQEIARRHGATLKVVEVPPGPPVLSPIVAEVYGPDAAGRRQVAQQLRALFERTPGLVDIDDSGIASAPRQLLQVDRRKAALLGVPQSAIVSTLAAGLGGEAAIYLHDQSKLPMPAWLQLPDSTQGDIAALLALTVRGSAGQAVPLRELVQISDSTREQPIFHKDLLPVHFVYADMAGRIDSPLYGLFSLRGELKDIQVPGGGPLLEYFVRPPKEAQRDYAVKWDGEWQITYETFRDMGLAYAVGLVLIYLLVVAQFGSYLTPLIIMAPIPLTLVGVMPGHALLHAQYTATSMIGMIALAGIIVRNSILLVDFIEVQLRSGMSLERAVVSAAITRAQPILLTGLAAMLGAFFILDDPIFNGLAISLIFGIAVSTALTLVVIPLLYFMAYRQPPVSTTQAERNFT
ncbi:efflux RND transporter permease subunit [Paucibacter sp. DJ2R-2]|uniref:efflux RND transporter permease subunit n=1 Tax=Paucibacter sp. DJ2R-2 TaxID=2893558 RepID=UPI0021E38A95|nr:efflux RND transporter permease subunit [Paucibacter sp. DJ2R-2]MCV2421983.1 efflux RND transporter permease subunit [Paucibacter sp. DJ4R-1]MCV2439400.1 efflux RND transporter permease subunit [Paucibacter sp. DJ2R-2]